MTKMFEIEISSSRQYANRFSYPSVLGICRVAKAIVLWIRLTFGARQSIRETHSKGASRDRFFCRSERVRVDFKTKESERCNVRNA